MENENDKKMIGTVSAFDGYYGYINAAEEKYLLMQSEVLDSINIISGDEVSFLPEIYPIRDDHQKKIARFVRKLEKKEENYNDIGIFSKK